MDCSLESGGLQSLLNKYSKLVFAGMSSQASFSFLSSAFSASFSIFISILNHLDLFLTICWYLQSLYRNVIDERSRRENRCWYIPRGDIWRSWDDTLYMMFVQLGKGAAKIFDPVYTQVGSCTLLASKPSFWAGNSSCTMAHHSIPTLIRFYSWLVDTSKVPFHLSSFLSSLTE